MSFYMNATRIAPHVAAIQNNQENPNIKTKADFVTAAQSKFALLNINPLVDGAPDMQIISARASEVYAKCLSNDASYDELINFFDAVAPLNARDIDVNFWINKYETIVTILEKFKTVGGDIDDSMENSASKANRILTTLSDETNGQTSLYKSYNHLAAKGLVGFDAGQLLQGIINVGAQTLSGFAQQLNNPESQAQIGSFLSAFSAFLPQETMASVTATAPMAAAYLSDERNIKQAADLGVETVTKYVTETTQAYQPQVNAAQQLVTHHQALIVGAVSDVSAGNNPMGRITKEFQELNKKFEQLKLDVAALEKKKAELQNDVNRLQGGSSSSNSNANNNDFYSEVLQYTNNNNNLNNNNYDNVD